MAILSKLPIDRAAARDFSALLWRDLPGAMLPTVDGAPFPSAEAMLHQRLSSTGHWDVPLVVGTRRIHLLAFAATTPVFDGPDDRNGRRNHDEVAFWARYLDGGLQYTPPLDPVVVLGNANLDPSDGDGLRRAIETLLTHARLQDPAPAAAGGAIAARLQGGANASQTGDPAHDTADWQDQPGPGNLRVSYVLPDMALKVLDAGVVWPVEGDPLYHVLSGENAPRHHMVWVDFDIPD
jgi:hypothetical protein